jgi:hypothetical protein
MHDINSVEGVALLLLVLCSRARCDSQGYRFAANATLT